MMPGHSTHLSATLQRVAGIAPGEAATIGSMAQGWFSAASVVDQLEESLARVACEYPGADPRTQGALFVNEYGYYMLAAPIAAYLLENRLPDLSPTNVALRWVTYTWEEADASGQAERLAVQFLSPRFAALPDDPAMREADATVLPDKTALRAHLREQIQSHFTPLIEAVHRQTGLSRGALWRLVADNVALLFLTSGQNSGQVAHAQQEGLAVLKEASSPLNNPQTGYFTVSANEQVVPFRARGGCCRYYTLPSGSKCSTCVLHPIDQRDARIAAYLERQASS